MSSRAVSAEIGGKLTAINVQNGQTVKAGDILFQLDSTELASQVANARLNLRQEELQSSTKADSANNQKVKAPINGQIVTLSVTKGQEVNSGQDLAIIRDTSKMKFDAVFNSTDALHIKTGQKATATSTEFAGSVGGRVLGVGTAAAGGTLVTIEVDNPGALSAGTTVDATIQTPSGTVYSSGGGTLEAGDEITVKSQVSGTVTKVSVNRNQKVSSGTILVQIDSSSARNEYEQQRLSLEQCRIDLQNLTDQLDKLTIKAPIDGVFAFDKKSGDSSDSDDTSAVATNAPYHIGDMVSSNDTFGTILGEQGLAVAVPIDEVDIAKVELGQVAQLSVDAVADKSFTGKVIQIAPQGTVNSGVTDFPVTILIDDAAGLKPNMTADVTIMVASKKNTLLVPVEAVPVSGAAASRWTSRRRPTDRPPVSWMVRSALRFPSSER
jgi:HlyD family secretion protein